MIDQLKTKNNSIKDLRLKLKQSPNRTSILELDTILATVADRKAFILLLDTFETEKEITRDLLELLIDHSFEINEDIIYYLENEINLSTVFSNIFDLKNIKSIILLALAVGIIVAIATNNSIADKVVDIAITKTQDNKE